MVEQDVRGPWRPDRRLALQDARNQGMAEQKEAIGPIAMIAPGWIDQADNLNVVG